jgi:RNA 3'-phosphate cyclase
MIEIDGSYGEGGGQIVRTSLFFSLITGNKVRIYNIRRGRRKPGLKPQHLTVIEALELLTDCEVEGAREGSLEITFKPGRIKGGEVSINIGTAGSITLLLQTLLPVLSFADRPSILRIEGGTDVPMSMSSDYLREIIIPHIKGYVDDLDFKVERRGFYPAGGGIVTLKIKPKFVRSSFKSLNDFIKYLRTRSLPLNIKDRGNPTGIKIISFASNHLRGRRVAERMVDGALSRLKELKLKAETHIKYGESRSPGCVLTIIALFDNGVRLGVDGLGKPGKPAEKVGEEVSKKLLNLLKTEATVDTHLQDNLIPWMALFGGIYRVNGGLTAHTKTNIWVSTLFLNTRFYVEGKTVKTEF